MNTPLALLGIGASLSFSGLRAHWRTAGIATLIKIVASPLAGLALAVGLGLSAGERLVALIFLACPTAAASYVMAHAATAPTISWPPGIIADRDAVVGDRGAGRGAGVGVMRHTPSSTAATVMSPSTEMLVLKMDAEHPERSGRAVPAT